MNECPICAGYGRVRSPAGVYRDCECTLRRRAEQRARELREASGIPDGIFERLTLDTWQPSQVRAPRCNATEILAACRAYAERPDGWLVIMGPVGVGKTHLAYGIAGDVLRRGGAVYAANVPSMLGMIRSGFGAGISAEHRIEQLRAVDVLVLDDWGTERTTDWVSEVLFAVLDARYLRRAPTVVTTNLPLHDMAAKGDRLASRLMDRELSHVLVLNAGDYRRRA